MTKIWCPTDNENEYTDALIIDMDKHIELDIGYMTSQSLAGVFPDTTIEIQTGHSPDDFFKLGGGMLVISEQVKSILEEFNVAAEYFSIKVVYNNTHYNEKKFYFCNTLDSVKCLDFKHGVYTFWSKPEFKDHVDKIHKLVIDSHSVTNYHLFRIANGAEYIVCVSDALADRLVASKCTGMKLVSPENWNLC